MTDANRFYLSTPIFYPNGEPHIGHAYSLIIADVFRRYQNQRHQKTLLITGTDENGQKISNQAEQNSLPPKDFVDKVSQQFQTRALELSENDENTR